MSPDHRHILGMRVDVTSYDKAIAQVAQWAQAGASKYVCVATVNNVMESFDSPVFRELTNKADLVTPDGMPLVWGLRLLGRSDATRVYGPDLTPLMLEMAAQNAIPVGFYGGSESTLRLLTAEAMRRFPNLNIAYAWSPPFRPLTQKEDEQAVQEINDSGTRILFIGLNTPKQDFWMAAHRGRVSAVMLGVGAAFDFMAGAKAQAPRWVMRIGMEWMFRLITEPRRLWRRYLKHNPRFVAFFALQLAGWRVAPSGEENSPTRIPRD